MARSDSLDDLFYVENLPGTAYFKVDSSGNVYWSGTSGSTSLEGGSIYIADGKGLYGGADQDWSFVHANTSDLVVTGVVVDVNLSGGLTIDATTISIDGTGASNLSTTAANLTLSTITSGTLAITSAGALNLTSVAASTWTHSTAGDLTIDNQVATGSTIMLLGTDTTAVDFQVQNNSAFALLTVTPTSATGGTTTAYGLAAKSATAAAITTTRVLTAADSGGCFSVDKQSAYAITLPTPAQGLRFKFMVLDTGANAVTISNGSAHLFGAINIANTMTAATGTTITLASGGSIGDWVEFEGIDATHYLVTGACIAAADITVA